MGRADLPGVADCLIDIPCPCGVSMSPPWWRDSNQKASGKAHKPYEFGVWVSVATTLNRSKGGQFAVHAKALPGKPYDGHTLQTILPDIETSN